MSSSKRKGLEEFPRNIGWSSFSVRGPNHCHSVMCGMLSREAEGLAKTENKVEAP